MKPDHAFSDEVVNSLRELRAIGDQHRAELYWNIQRVSRSRRSVAAFSAELARRKQLRIFQQPLIDLCIHNTIPPHAA